MVLPHLLALWCAWRSSLLAAREKDAGIAIPVRPEGGVFVLAACGILMWRTYLLLGYDPNTVRSPRFRLMP